MAAGVKVTLYIIRGDIMKVLFKHLIQGYTGKADDIILYYDRRFNKVIARVYVPVKLTQKHRDFGEIAKNIRRLNLSEAYKQDFKIYTDLYSRMRVNYEHPVSNWYNLFIRMMFKMAQMPGIDLKTITRYQIELLSLPCISVKAAVDAELLPRVRNYESLDNPL
jgi:hypothetical protein